MRRLAPVVFACATALPAVAAAQRPPPTTAATAPRSATAPAALGGLAVVGLRTPDGDVDLAGALTTALRAAARARGYEVPDNTPSFDQEFAMLGCSTTSPECLSHIAADIHAQKYLYGTLLRVGRGREAPMTVEVSLWDDVTHREVHREAATVTRAQINASPDFLRDLARQMLDALATRDAAAQAERARLQAAEAVLRAQERPANGAATATTVAGTSAPGPTPAGTAPAVVSPGGPSAAPSPAAGSPSHLLRWVGFGLLGAGVVAGGLGVWQWANTAGYGDDSRDGTGEFGGAWARYDNAINAPNSAGARALTVDQVCERARADVTNPDARGAASLCDAQGQAQAMALAFGVGGLVLAGVGAAFVVVDGASPSARREGQSAPPRASLRVSPLLAPGLGGVHLGMSF